MLKNDNNAYDRGVKSLNDSDNYAYSGESEYSRERSDPYQMVDYMIDHGFDHRGKGPKGYTISDSKIRENVCEILAHDGRIDATEIEVEVNEGHVFLKGQVDSRQTKRLAEITLENLPGVIDIINQLRF